MISKSGGIREKKRTVEGVLGGEDRGECIGHGFFDFGHRCTANQLVNKLAGE